MMNAKSINESPKATKSSESNSLNIKMNDDYNDRKHPPYDQLLQQKKQQQQQQNKESFDDEKAHPSYDQQQQQQQQQQKDSLTSPGGNFPFDRQQQQQQQKESRVGSPDEKFRSFDQQKQHQQQLIKIEEDVDGIDDDDDDDDDDDNSDTEYSITDALGPYDIICGRGSVAFNNCGNRRFRVLIGLNVDEYIAINGRHRKGLFIASLVRTIIHGIGAKFCKLSKNNSELTELTETQIRAKVGHALRDMAAFQYLQEKQQQNEQQRQRQQQQQQQQRGGGRDGNDVNTNTTTSDDKPSPVASSKLAKRRRRRRSSLTFQKKLKAAPLLRSSFSAPSLSSVATRPVAELIQNTMNTNVDSSTLTNHLRNFTHSSSTLQQQQQQQQQQRPSFVGSSSLVQQQNFRNALPPLHMNASAVQHQPIAPTPALSAVFHSNNISNNNNNDNEMMKIHHPMTYRPGMFETPMGAFDFQSQQQQEQQQQQGGSGGGGGFRRSSSSSSSSSKDTKCTASITKNYDPLMMDGRFFPVSANNAIGAATDKVHQQLQLQLQQEERRSSSSNSGSAVAQEAINVLALEVLALEDRIFDINNDPIYDNDNVNDNIINDDPFDGIDFISLDATAKQQQRQGQAQERNQTKPIVDKNYRS
jgi:hypothetical protein